MEKKRTSRKRLTASKKRNMTCKNEGCKNHSMHGGYCSQHGGKKGGAVDKAEKLYNIEEVRKEAYINKTKDTFLGRQKLKNYLSKGEKPWNAERNKWGGEELWSEIRDNLDDYKKIGEEAEKIEKEAFSKKVKEDFAAKLAKEAAAKQAEEQATGGRRPQHGGDLTDAEAKEKHKKGQADYKRAIELYDESEEIRKQAYINIHEGSKKLEAALMMGMKPWNKKRNKYGDYVIDYEDGIVTEIRKDLQKYEDIIAKKNPTPTGGRRRRRTASKRRKSMKKKHRKTKRLR